MSELEDPLFNDLLYKYDICLFNETWRKEESKIALPGLWDFSLIRPKNKKAGRHSGGITIFCKERVRRGLRIIDASEGFIWVKLDANFFNLTNDLFLCAAYIPPENTSKSINLKTDYFQSLTESLMKYSDQGNILIMGDLNARVGMENVGEVF